MKRSRRASPSPDRPSTSDSRSSHQSAAPRKKNELAPNDLMAADKRKQRPDNGRLSREDSPSRSSTPELSIKGAADPVGD